jgi:hypothetical protein
MKVFTIMRRYQDAARRVNEFQSTNDIIENTNKIKPYIMLLLEQKHYAYLLMRHSSSSDVIKAAKDCIRSIDNIIVCANIIKKTVITTFVN